MGGDVEGSLSVGASLEGKSVVRTAEGGVDGRLRSGTSGARAHRGSGFAARYGGFPGAYGTVGAFPGAYGAAGALPGAYGAGFGSGERSIRKMKRPGVG